MAEMGLLQRSFYGGVLILVVIAVRAVLLDRLPKRTFLILWGVVLLRLLVPVSLSSAFSVYSVLGQKLGTGQKAEEWRAQMPQTLDAAYDMGEDYGYGVSVFLAQLTGQSAVPMEEEMSTASVIHDNGDLARHGFYSISVLLTIWCAGACICAVFFIAVYFRCLREFRMALPVEDSAVQRWLEKRTLRRTFSVRQSDRISTPLTYGIFRPVILLPKKIMFDNSRKLEYVLQHEYVHIRHCDAALKLVLTAALCIHWFNPLVWVMYGLMNRDIELACDEGVLHWFGEKSKSGYALTLIGMEERQSGMAALYNGFSRNAIERRIKSIMKYRKKTFATFMIGMILVIAVALIFATSAQKTVAAGAKSTENGTGADNGEILMDPPKREENMPVGEKETGTDFLAGNMGTSGTGSLAGNVGISGTGSLAGNTQTPDADSPVGNADAFSSDQPEGYTLTFTVEGFEEKEPADLYVGKGYGILIPSEGWNMYRAGAWMADVNEQIQLIVNYYDGKTKEQVAEELISTGYFFEEDSTTKLRMYFDDKVQCVELIEQTAPAETKTWGIICRFPLEAEEGFGVCLNAMAASFRLMPEADTVNGGAEPEPWQSMPESVYQKVQGMPDMREFWKAYLSGDSEALMQYLAEDFEGAPDVFPDGLDGHNVEKAELLTVKWQETEGKEIGDKVECSLEIRPGEGDSLEYLTIGLIKEQDGWKISWYGLEK